MGLESGLGDNVITTTLSKMINWARKSSLWPMPFGTACCAIEMMATLSGRFDMARFGAEAVRFSPRQSDLLIVSGRISIKMMPGTQENLRSDAGSEMGDFDGRMCVVRGAYSIRIPWCRGVDQFLPVDIYVPGCPPPPRGSPVRADEDPGKNRPGTSCEANSGAGILTALATHISLKGTSI